MAASKERRGFLSFSISRAGDKFSVYAPASHLLQDVLRLREALEQAALIMLRVGKLLVSRVMNIRHCFSEINGASIWAFIIDSIESAVVKYDSFTRYT